ncbi:U4/U6 x U5 tri-snRNP complex subunit Prp1 [Coemansia sp. RSA 1086]|nr:U4/U6 x U5 tri-snRNP complex subunit Prp1 [Coemansia sp. RSA 1086]
MYSVTKDFLGKPAPPGYIAGLGRGATGFTTRSDIGPAREAAASTDKSDKDKTKAQQEAEDDVRFANAENEEGLFSNMPYEEDDEEADKIWTAIDAKMEQRRKGKRKQPDDQLDGGIVDEQLQGLKRQLQDLSEADWNAIPDVSQLAESAARAKRRRKSAVSRRGERYSQVSDSTLVAGLGLIGYDREISTDADTDGTTTNFLALGQARDDVLRMKLDQAGDSATGKTTIDPRGYLTSLSTLGAQTAEIGDTARARTLLKSITQTNPKHAPGWIAAARLEEVAQKPGKARSIIAQGCENCPQSEEIWLEAARLSPRDEARAVLASAVRNVPRSVRVWAAAAELEAQAGDVAAQRRVLRRALELVPTSVQLWKMAVALEPADDARVLLAYAVELVPLSVDLWLDLARLEPYSQAQKVLNRARRAVPTSHEVWIAAARLEEQQGQPEAKISRIMAKAVAALARSGAPIDREQWFDQALQCEKEQFPMTCRAIVAAAASLGFDRDDSAADRAAAWTAEAEKFVPQKPAGPGLETARAILAQALDAQPADADLWRTAADLEREHGTAAHVDALLKRAVQYCPQNEVLWLMAAKEKWVRQGDVAGARVILEEAYAANPRSEAIVLAAVKLESETGQDARALALLERARASDFGEESARKQMQRGTPRVWMKSAVLLRQTDQLDAAADVAAEGAKLFPDFFKLWLVLAQVQHQLGRTSNARQTLAQALKTCSRSPELWIFAAQLAFGTERNLARARAVLERARVFIPQSPQLWLEAVRMEANESEAVARTLMARALQECPWAGSLWAEAIFLEPRAQRKAKSVDALKHADAHDPAVTAAVARLFWSERRVEKARLWFERAARADPDYGDAWAWWLRFEQEQPQTDANAVENIVHECERAEPHHGQLWPQVAKDPANARLPLADILFKTAELLKIS